MWAREVKLLVIFCCVVQGSSQKVKETACEDRLTILPSKSEMSKVQNAPYPLHVNYNLWALSDFNLSKQPGSLLLEYNPRFNSTHQEAGYILYGTTYATGRQCMLKAISIHGGPSHKFDVDMYATASDLDTFILVSFEIQLHHKCLTPAAFDKRIEDDKKRIQKMADEQNTLTEKMHSTMIEAAGDVKISRLKAFREELDGIAKRDKFIKEEIANAQEDIIHASGEIRLNEAYHQADLGETVIIVLPVGFAGNQGVVGKGPQELFDFLHAALEMMRPNAGTIHKSKANIVSPNSLLSSAAAVMYNGSARMKPCDTSVEWIVLDSPLIYEQRDVSRLSSLMDTLGLLQDNSASKVKADMSKLFAVHLDDRFMPKPKYTAKQVKERMILFVPIICFVGAAGLLVHAYTADETRVVPLIAFFVSIILLVVLGVYDLAFFPGPDTSVEKDQYGFWEVVSNPLKNFEFSLSMITSIMPLVLTMFFLAAAKKSEIFLVPFFLVFHVIQIILFYLYAHHSLGAFQDSLAWVSNPALIKGFFWLLIIVMLFVLGVFAFAASFIFSVITKGISLAYGPVLLAIYHFFSGMQWVSVFTWWQHKEPLTHLVIIIGWYGLPVLSTMIVAPWLVLPLWAYQSGRANCVDSFDWEVHVSFAIVIMMKSFMWKLVAPYVPPCFDSILAWGFYVLKELDMYTDAMFIAIATQCGSWYGYIACILYIVGVLVLQILLPVLLFGLGAGGGGSGVEAAWTLLVFPLNLLTAKGDLSITSKRLGAQLRMGRDTLPTELQVAWSALVLAIVTCVCEDAPQCVIQYLFTVHVKKNPLIVFSIGCSACSSVFAVGKAVHTYCKAKGADMQTYTEMKLPPGWTQHSENATGKVYYFNAQLGKSQWEMPME